MSTLPVRTLTSITVDPSELYTKLIYEPAGAAPHESFEALNGGLDPVNWTGQAPAWSWQYGAFAQGKWYGFDQHEYVYAKQLGGGGRGGALISERAVLAQHTATIFLPWDASVVLYGVQAFFQHDATRWHDNQAGNFQEFWDYRIEFNDAENVGMYGRLPHTRWANGATPTSGTDPGLSSEERWRYVSKFGMAKNVPKGHNMLRMSLWAGVFGPDIATAKVAIPTGGVWVLALR